MIDREINGFIERPNPRPKRRLIGAGRKRSRGGSYHADAVHFPGTAYLSINSMSAPNGGFFGMSFWSKGNPAQGNNLWTTAPAGDGTPNTRYHSDGFQVYMSDAGQNNTMFADTGAFNSSWHHFLAGVQTNLSAGNKIIKLYIDDVDVTTGISDDSASFSNAINALKCVVGGDGSASENFVGDMADFRLLPNVNLLTGSAIAEATRRLFIDANGKPVDPAVATAALGVAGAVLFSGDATAFVTNQGTGGAFTLTGSLTNASTSPSD